MTGPYEYVAPSYWLLDKTRGGAHGFNTETSPGPAIPPVESLRRMLPEDHLWPIDSVVGLSRRRRGVSRHPRIYGGPQRALRTSRRPRGLRPKAQVMAYEGERAMFEAFGRNKYTSTGVIQWMLNNAWPSMIWHLYDYYLRPGGSYFGAKKACEPLHVQYSTTTVDRGGEFLLSGVRGDEGRRQSLQPRHVAEVLQGRDPRRWAGQHE